MLATAVVPVVAAISATSTAPTPTGTTSQARHWLTKVPIRIGRSTRWKETTETANVTSTRTAKSSYPSSPVRSWSSQMKIGQCQM